MRKFLVSAAIAASTLVAAAPAAAQWYPPQPQGYGYGYNNYGQVRAYQVRIDRLHQRIHHLQGRLSRSEFSKLNRDIDNLQYRLRRASYGGLGPQEARDMSWRIERLERTIYRDARDGNGHRHDYQYSYNQYGWDRDRDGLDDRYERDRGTNYDEDHDRH